MPHLARHLALAACLTLVGTTADAAPRHKAKTKLKAKKLQHEDTAAVDDIALESDEEEADEPDEESADEAEEETVDEEEEPVRKRSRRARAKGKSEVGFVEDGESAELVDAPVRKKTKKVMRDWHIAFGPNMWLAAVKANVAVGAKEVTAAIDVLQISRQTKFALPLLVEGRYKRFSFVGDLTYAVLGLKGGNDVGPLMVTVDGTISSLQFDGLAGYRVFGNDHTKLAFEARAGVRYARTGIAGKIGLSGSEFNAEVVDASTDFLAGARVYVRPFSRLFATATVDQSLFGTSSSTWSVGADANVRITSHVLFAAGWKTMTQQKATIATTMYGPKLMLQVLF